jgi:hypothetical protein
VRSTGASRERARQQVRDDGLPGIVYAAMTIVLTLLAFALLGIILALIVLVASVAFAGWLTGWFEG